MQHLALHPLLQTWWFLALENDNGRIQNTKNKASKCGLATN